MSGTLSLELDRETGSLQRLLGLIERRGYMVTSVMMPGGSDALSLTLGVQAHGDRTIDTLIRQIQKLHTVRSVAAC